ncbi:MAG: hypothetical protein C5S48_01935 [Candidatus Methanogaster sp.]|nr:MAG: hypothetical protein C5S48_01935 [ANME-2 cluster archaeon]
MKRDCATAATSRTPTENARSSNSLCSKDPKLSRSVGESTAEGWQEEHINNRAVETFGWLLGRS